MTKPRHLGRTGRAGKQGTAITFLTNDDDEVMCVVYGFLPRDGAGVDGCFACMFCLSVGMT